MPRLLRSLALSLVPTLSLAHGQGPSLTLNEALRLAKERNGAIQAAQYDVRAAQSRVSQAYAPFLPTLTPQFQYNNIRNDGRQPLFTQDGASTVLSGTWRLLDSGERDYSFRSSKRTLDATKFNSTQTLRTTLFGVTEDYFEALRAQELQRVTEDQVKRAQQIVDQTEARILAKDAAEIERLQANADFQNAKVQALVARNQVISSTATLKSAIGYESDQQLPTLAREDQPLAEVPSDLNQIVKEGLQFRPDLRSRRSSIESERISRQRAQREANISFAVDLLNDFQFTPNQLNNRSVGFVLSYPLFDGGRRREIVRELGANVAADQALLTQAEREAQAEIEATYRQAETNMQRLTAAQVALDAAQKNYQASVDSRFKGAAALQQVLTAQSSLLVAESNFINAQYDMKIADVRLRLVTGRPVPGEDSSASNLTQLTVTAR